MLLNDRNSVNHPPTVDPGPDETIPYQNQWDEEGTFVQATGSDPDAHALRYQWADESGHVFSNFNQAGLPIRDPGVYKYTVTVTDGRGGSGSATKTVTIAPTKEIVLHAGAIGEQYSKSLFEKSSDTLQAAPQGAGGSHRALRRVGGAFIKQL